MQQFTIWVDADSCQSKARETILALAAKNNIAVNYVANRNIPFTIKNPLFNMIICEKNKDAADNYIANHCIDKDIIVTRDLLLAKALIDKEYTVINDKGTIFTDRILEKMLKERELSLQMASLGIRNGKFNTYSKEDTVNFSKTLSSIIQERIAS